MGTNVSAAIAAWLERRPRPEFHTEMFGGPSASDIDRGIKSFAAAHVGPIGDPDFYVVSRGAVAGANLEDGSRVAIKFLPRSHERLEILHEARSVQRAAFERGLPVAEPLVGPVEWRSNFCFVDAWLPSDAPPDGARADVRAAMARNLASLVNRLSDIDSEALRETRYKLPSTAPQCELPGVDAALEWSHRVLSASGDRPVTAGHFDWRTPNAVVGENGDMQAVYDWDSVVIDLEQRILGAAAAFFSVGYTTEYSSVPTPAEVADFVNVYEAARGEDFDASDRGLIAAAAVYKLAWHTREEQLLDPTGAKEHDRSIRRAFRRFPMDDYVDAIRS